MANRLKLLSFDTSTHACTAALQIITNEGEFITTTSHVVAPMKHTQLLLPMIDNLLSEAGLTPASLDLIAVGVGPGSLTGARLAVSVAQGFALANQTPVVPVSTLAAIAKAHFTSVGDRAILVSLDARAGHVYYGGYLINEAGLPECVIPEQWISPDQMLYPPTAPWVKLGDGFMQAPSYPTGAAIAALGLAKFKAEGALPPSALEPAYLHEW